MKSTMTTITVGLIALFAMPNLATALTMNQFSSICQSAEMPCSKVPILNAYVGGALDLIAMLDEETGYLDKVYCKPTKTLFDVPTIIQYMEKKQTQFADKNAMLVLIRYLEEHGGCQREKG